MLPSALDPSVITAITAPFADVTELVTTNLVPAFFTLLLLGIGIAVAVKYVRKGSRAV